MYIAEILTSDNMITIWLPKMDPQSLQWVISKTGHAVGTTDIKGDNGGVSTGILIDEEIHIFSIISNLKYAIQECGYDVHVW